MRRSRKSDKSILLLLVIIAIVVATALVGVYTFRTDPLTKKIKAGEPFAVLFLVHDNEDLRFLQLLLYHPETHRGGLFYIPPNLGTKIPSLERFDRLAMLYSAENTSTLRQKLEQITDIEIPFYLSISTQDIVNLVDLAGGLELFISNPVDIEYGEKRILLPSGSVLLDGDKTRDYITYEQELEEDREIVGRRQKFLTALLKKMGVPSVSDLLLQADGFRLLREYLDTNLNAKALRALVAEMQELQTDRMVYQRVLGNARNIDGVEGPLLFPHYDGNLIKQTIKQNLETIASPETGGEDTLTVTMEILNGTSVDGLAGRTEVLYESFGFEVISVRNADHDRYLNTVILDRKGKFRAAERASDVIRCSRVYSRLDPESNVDVTLILGKDFDGRYCNR